MPRWQNLAIALASNLKKKACVRKDFSVQIRALASIFINSVSLPRVMGDMRLNTTFIILLVIALILFTAYYIIVSLETEEKDYGGLKEITGKVQSFEVSHGETNFYKYNRKNAERYDDKLFAYLEHIQDRRDETFFR